MKAASRGMRPFFTVAVGQLVSSFGTGLTGFALGIWVLQRTGSVTNFALVILLANLPALLITPVAGALVDRWDRRRTMMLGDLGSALCTLTVMILISSGRLKPWQLGIILALSASCAVFQSLAFAASVVMLVPKEQLGRANGIVQFIQLSEIFAPLAAGLLIQVINVEGVLLVDFGTYLFGLLALSLVRFPRPEKTTPESDAGGSLLRQTAYGWRFIKSRPGMLGLLLYYAAMNLVLYMGNVLAPPMLLKFTSVAVIGTMLSLAGVAMVSGSLVMSAWGGPRRRVYGVLGFGLVRALSVSVMGLRPSALVVGAGLLINSFSMMIISGCHRVLWQTKTPPDVQGRVFATAAVIMQSTAPVAYLIAGPLADRVFEPLLAVGGPLANNVGLVIGVGPGRGIGLLHVIMGLLLTLVTIICLINPRIRLIEDELPDAVTPKTAGEPLVPREVPASV